MKALHSGWIALLALGLLSPDLPAVTCGELDSEQKVHVVEPYDDVYFFANG